MRFLKYLFLQYDDGKRVPFPSKFLKLHGELLAGKPQDKGLDLIRPDLQRTYYYNKTERGISTDFEEEMERAQTAILRSVEERQIAMGAAFGAMPVVLVIVLLAGLVQGVGSIGARVKNGLTSSSTSELVLPGAEQCEAIKAKAAARTLKPSDFPDADRTAFNNRWHQLGIY